MGRLPGYGGLVEARENQDRLPRNREEADLLFCSVIPLQKCETGTEMAVQINRMGVIDRLSQGASGKSPNRDKHGTTPNPDPEKPLPLSRRSGGAP